MKKIAILLGLLSLSGISIGQSDTISAMFYNLLDFPSGGSTRVDTLRKIIRYVEPDIFVVNELESSTGANSILNNAMNTDGVTHYSKATFYNGYDTDNMLYYNNEKLGLLDQAQIATDLRDISEYKMYYKEDNMSAATDTIYLWVYGCHLKAGSTQPDADQRATEATDFKNYLQANNRSGNMIIGGDFNVYTSSEAACQTILNDGTVPFNDPINMLGNWNNNSFYKNIHTQCTRSSTGFAGGASGGMDDRFDIIFATDPIMQGTEMLQYVSGSYKSVGQDGNHFNQDINSGTNTAVPADIANALFYNSDHLPVYMELEVLIPVGIQEQNELISNYFFNGSANEMRVLLKDQMTDGMLQLYAMSGQLIYSEQLQTVGKEFNVQFPDLAKGTYLCSISSSFSRSVVKIVKD